MISSKAICILGMHRSGTSVVSRSINLLGAYLGEAKDLMCPLEDNPDGYWERYDIVSINDRMLHKLKTTWDTVIPLPHNWYLSEEMKPFRDEITSLFQKNFIDKKLWAWKDPRSALVLPIWHHVLRYLNIELSCVFVIRNPLDVAKSLNKRNGFPYDKSFGIWFNYSLAALQSISKLQTVFISYDKLIENYKLELQRFTDVIGVKWSGDDSLFKREINLFIRPSLRHSVSTLDDLIKQEPPFPVIKLYRLLETALKSHSNPGSTITDSIENLAKEFYSYNRFFQYDNMLLWELKHKLAENEELLAQKDRELKFIEEQIKRIFNSRSWKITVPLRWLLDRTQRLIPYRIIKNLKSFL